MSKHAQRKGRISSKKIRRLILVSLIVAVFALGATAAVSLRTSQLKQQAEAKNSTSPTTSVQSNNPGNTGDARANLRLRAGGPIPMSMPLDPQTGQVRPLTQEEAERLAVSIKALVNQSTDGLQPVQHADGSVSLDLQGRFQSMAVARRNEEGELVESCVDNREAAAAFFEIDPALVGVKKNATAPKTNAAAQPKGEVR